MDIKNKYLVENIYGRWPDFHDATFYAINLVTNQEEKVDLFLTLLAFEYAEEVDSTGYYIQRSHAYVSLKFSDVAISSVQFRTFPDIVFSLTINKNNIADGKHSTRPINVEIVSVIEEK